MGDLARINAALDPVDLDSAVKVADMLSKSGLVPQAFRGKAPDILLAIMGGRELGFSTIQSLRSFYVISGRLGMYSDAMIAVCVSKPFCKYFRLVSSDDKQATYETQRDGSQPVTLSYTLEQAKASGLTSNQNYAKHPAAMLRARCSAALARIVYPDALAGVYAPEEMEPGERQPYQATAEARPVETVTMEGEILPAEIDQSPDDTIRVPFGKNAGKALADLTLKQLQAYVEIAQKKPEGQAEWLLHLEDEILRRGDADQT